MSGPRVPAEDREMRRPKGEATARVEDASAFEDGMNPEQVTDAVTACIDPEQGGSRDSGEFAVVADPARLVRALGAGTCAECGESFESCRC